MKKLKLPGRKKGFLGRSIQKIVATIYVKDGQVVIESDLPSFRALRDQIQEIGETTGFHIVSDVATEHSRETRLSSPYKIGDPEFLEALASAPFLYSIYDGWAVGSSRNPIVDE